MLYVIRPLIRKSDLLTHLVLLQLGHMQWLASLNLDKIFFRKLAAANDRYEAFSREMAFERMAKGDNVKVKDVFYFLQKGRDPVTGAGFTQDELIAEASLLILGG